MKKLLTFCAFVLAAVASVSTSLAAPDVRTVVREAPVLVKAGKIKESVELLLRFDSLVGRSILEKKSLARVFQDTHDELLKREKYVWLYKLDEHARKLFPRELSSGANFGEVCIVKGDFKLAARLLREAAAQSNSYYPKNPKKRKATVRVNLLLAQATLVLGEVKEAEQAIDKALAVSPADAQLYYTRAQVMMRAKKWKQVAKALDKAFSIDPALAQPVDYLVRASCAQREGAYGQARKVLEEGLERYPTAPGLHYGLGQVFQALGESARAFYLFQHEIMLSGPGSSYTDEAKDQIEITTALIDKEKDRGNYLKVAYGAAALVNMSPGSYEKAIENIKKGLRANGDDCLPLQVLLGHAYVGLDEHEQAIKAFEAALRVDPFFVPAYVDLGNAYEKLGKRDKALEHYAKALTLDKHNWRVREMLKAVDELK